MKGTIVNKKKKLLILAIVLLLGIAGIGFAALMYENNPVHEAPRMYYSESENSIDVLFVGGSSLYRCWNAPAAFTDSGIASYVYGSTGMPMPMLKYVIHDALKTQNPEVIVIDLRLFSQNAESRTNADARLVTLYMPASIDRLKAIYACIEYDSEFNTKIIKDPKYFRLPLSYDWNPDEINYLREYRGAFKGFAADGKTWLCEPQDGMNQTDKVIDIDPYYAKKLDLLMDYCDTINTQVVFLIAPCNLYTDRLIRLNAAEEYVRARGYEVWDDNNSHVLKEAGLNLSEDFYDSLHMNCLGAEKYTKYLGKRLTKKYQLPDRRGDKTYNSWIKADELLQPMIDEYRETRKEPTLFIEWKNSLKQKVQ